MSDDRRRRLVFESFELDAMEILGVQFGVTNTSYQKILERQEKMMEAIRKLTASLYIFEQELDYIMGLVGYEITEVSGHKVWKRPQRPPKPGPPGRMAV